MTPLRAISPDGSKTCCEPAASSPCCGPPPPRLRAADPPARREDIARTLSTDAPETLAEALADASGELLASGGGELVGAARWALINRRSRIADIRRVMLAPAARGRGVATEAIRELTQNLFRDRWLHRLEAEVYGLNVSGQRDFECAGFREGVRRRAYDREDGWQDGVRYGLLSDER